jgi:hypothetical protein
VYASRTYVSQYEFRKALVTFGEFYQSVDALQVTLAVEFNELGESAVSYWLIAKRFRLQKKYLHVE